MTEDIKTKDWWDKGHIIANSIAILLIPVLVGYFGSEINSAIKDKEISQKYVELAIGLLKNDPGKQSPALREWAINIVNANSPVKIDTKVREELKSNPLRTVRVIQPKKIQGNITNTSTNFLTDEKGNILTDENGNALITESDPVTMGGEPVTFGGKRMTFGAKQGK